MTILRPRRQRPRPRTLALRLLAKEPSDELEVFDERPRTRGDCEGGERPCPWVGCKYHLFLEVTRTGSIKFNFPELEPGDLAETCALDVADHGGETLDVIGTLMNLTRERVRQIEMRAQLRARLPLACASK